MLGHFVSHGVVHASIVSTISTVTLENLYPLTSPGGGIESVYVVYEVIVNV